MTPLSYSIAHSLPEIILALGALALLMLGAFRAGKGDWIITEASHRRCSALRCMSMFFQLGERAHHLRRRLRRRRLRPLHEGAGARRLAA